MNIMVSDDLDSQYSSVPYDRVSIHLPSSDDAEKNAAGLFITYVSRNYPGYSYSNVERPAFVGKWKSKKNTYTDEICILFVDVRRDVKSLYQAKFVADDLYKLADMCYQTFGRRQISFWVYIEEIVIRSKDDKKTEARKRKAKSDLIREMKHDARL